MTRNMLNRVRSGRNRLPQCLPHAVSATYNVFQTASSTKALLGLKAKLTVETKQLT